MMIKPAKTSHQLRILANQIEEDTAPDYILVVVNPDDTISSAVRAIENPYLLTGFAHKVISDIEAEIE